MPSENQRYQPKAPVIRELLHQFPEGLSIGAICRKTGISERVARPTLRKMVDCYINRWMFGKYQKPPEAIWCIVAVPKDCPKPISHLRHSVQSVGNQLAT